VAVAVVTDSTCDLTPAFLRQLGIYMVPLMVTIEGATYRDQLDITSERYLEMLANTRSMPKTAAPSPGVLASSYRQALADGASEVVAIHLSAQLSATVRAALTAQALVGEAVEVIDSASASLGIGLLVWWAALSARSGASGEEVAAEVRSLLERVELGFSPLTLEYLARGGRIGGGARWVGTLLDMKPVLKCEHGSIQTYKKVRGGRQVVPAIMQSLRAKVPPGSSVLAGVMHANNVDEAHRLEEAMRSIWVIEGMLSSVCGPVLATHGGPGAFGGVVVPLNSDETLRWRRWTNSSQEGPSK